MLDLNYDLNKHIDLVKLEIQLILFHIPLTIFLKQQNGLSWLLKMRVIRPTCDKKISLFFIVSKKKICLN